jgi:hypothetical protein
MRRYLLVSMALVVSGVLVWHGGCSKEQKGAAGVKPDKAAVAAAPAAKAEKAAKSNEPQPKIVFEKTLYDFGPIAPGGKHTCEFKFKNTGKGVLRVGKINSSCGCTVPKLAKEEYAPGESGAIKVEYSASKSPGEIKKTLSVSTNDKENENITLTVTALIAIKVECKPESMNLSLKEANGGCPKITLRSLDSKPFTINGFKSTADCVSLDYDPKVQNTEFIIQPKVDVEKLQKNLNGHIEIGLTHPECNAVSVSYTALPRFGISPPSIVVFDAKPENPVKKQVVIISNYGDSFEIESVTSQKGILKVLSQERGNGRWTLDVEVTPPTFNEGKPRMFTDLLTIGVSGGQKLEVTARGFYPSAKKQ